MAVTSTTVDETPLKYVWASLHTPVEETVADDDTVFEADTLIEAALEPVIEVEPVLEALTEAEVDLEPLIEADSVLEPEDETDDVLVSVGSIDALAEILLLTLVLAETLLLIVILAVSEAVKLGETGDAVTDGVIDGVGKNTVYDRKNADPLDAILIISAPVMPPPLS